MSFYLEETCNIPFDFAYAKLAEDVIAFCLSHENFPYEAEVNLTLTDNEEIHRINLEYRQIDRPTDVLSFPMLSYGENGIPRWRFRPGHRLWPVLPPAPSQSR